jgi:hypothetical protein
MQYAKLETAPTTDMDYCFVGRILHSDTCDIRISDGDKIGPRYPGDPFSVKVHFDVEFPGVKVPTLIGNTRSLLIVSAQSVAFFEKHLNLGDHEAFPFSLVHHKGRVHSRDYVFLNPVGSHDVADPSSAFVRYKSGGIYDCGKWILVKDKLQGLPDLIRPKELTTVYLVSERFIELVEKHGMTNFEFTHLQHV